MAKKEDRKLIWKKTDKSLRKLLREVRQEPDGHEKSVSMYLVSLRDSLNAILLTFGRILENVDARSELIKQQVNTETFHGELHENYHEVSGDLNSDLDTLFSQVKTMLNRIPPLVAEYLSHSAKRAIRSRSFGSFLNSLARGKTSWEGLGKLHNILLKDGVEIDEENNEYRDKYIEHKKYPKPGVDSMVSDSEGGIKKIHWEGEVQRKRPVSGLGNSRDGFIIFEGDAGIEAVFVHVSPKKDLKEGVKVEKGEFIGHTSSHGPHFEKYGPHTHVFMRPGGDIIYSATEVFNLQDLPSKESPEALHIFQKTLLFVRFVLEELYKLEKRR